MGVDNLSLSGFCAGPVAEQLLYFSSCGNHVDGELILDVHDGKAMGDSWESGR